MAVNDNATNKQKEYSLEHIANRGFDNETQLPMVELVGFDEAGGVMRKVTVDTDGKLVVNASGVSSMNFIQSILKRVLMH